LPRASARGRAFVGVTPASGAFFSSPPTTGLFLFPSPRGRGEGGARGAGWGPTGAARIRGNNIRRLRRRPLIRLRHLLPACGEKGESMGPARGERGERMGLARGEKGK